MLCPQCKTGKCGTCPEWTLQHVAGRPWLVIPTPCECPCQKIDPMQMRLWWATA